MQASDDLRGIAHAVVLNTLDFCDRAFFSGNPNLLEQVIEANLVIGRCGGAAIGGVRQGTRQRMAGTVLRGIEMQTAVSQFDAAISLPSEVILVTHRGSERDRRPTPAVARSSRWDRSASEAMPVTIEDPKVFRRPWNMNMILYRHKEKNFQLYEYECYGFDYEKLYPYPDLGAAR